ncbi:MAG: hypothetical protein IT177_02840 [Acidobacteria bacterium]|nr:hypothetical protein [Acidobacteriota bacterium]
MDTPLLTDDFKEFLKLLNANRVEYLISLPDLKANKRAAGRHKDLADLDNLP